MLSAGPYAGVHPSAERKRYSSEAEGKKKTQFVKWPEPTAFVHKEGVNWTTMERYKKLVVQKGSQKCARGTRCTNRGSCR